MCVYTVEVSQQYLLRTICVQSPLFLNKLNRKDERFDFVLIMNCSSEGILLHENRLHSSHVVITLCLKEHLFFFVIAMHCFLSER